VRTAHLLLALEDEADRKRQLAERALVRLDRAQSRDQVALVVRDAARPDATIADVGPEGLVAPQLERLGRLDVVVVVQLKLAGARAGDNAVDDRWPALELDALGGSADRAGHVLDHRGGFQEPDAVRGDRGLAAQCAQALDELLGVLVDVVEDGLQRGAFFGQLGDRHPTTVAQRLDVLLNS